MDNILVIGTTVILTITIMIMIEQYGYMDKISQWLSDKDIL